MHITGVASYLDRDLLTLSLESSGGQIVGSGSEVALSTTQLEPSQRTVTGHVSDGRGWHRGSSCRITYIKGQLLSAGTGPPRSAMCLSGEETEKGVVCYEIGDHDKQRIDMIFVF